jgi:hypothetical protein
MEIIKSVREVFDYPYNLNTHRTGDGYEIVTDKQTIHILIDNEQSCCEQWGYLTSEDDLNSFIGAELFGITKTDTELKTYDLPEEECAVIFVNLETSQGTLQFTVYNIHNGYYGHTVVVRSEQLNIEDRL